MPKFFFFSNPDCMKKLESATHLHAQLVNKKANGEHSK